MEDKQLNEIMQSVESYVKTYGIEGAEDLIKRDYQYRTKLKKTMLFILYDKYNFGGNKK